jgi:hypothetical protein
MTVGDLTITDGTTTVDIWTTQIELNIDKPITAIPLPRTGSKKTTEEATAYIIDIGRANQIITINGFLVDESGTSAYAKRTSLINLSTKAANLTVAWGNSSSATNSYVGNIQKISIQETGGVIGDAQPTGYGQEKQYTIQIAFIIGTNKVS